MGRKGRVLLAALVLAALIPCAAAARTNIVLIVTDDQRWDTLSAMPKVQSELVAKGVTFSNAFAVNPLCCPARASILTGRYSHTTRVYGNWDLPKFDERKTIALALRRASCFLPALTRAACAVVRRYPSLRLLRVTVSR